MDIIVGTCGYGGYSPPDGWKAEYESKLAAFADAFAAVELNRTFYELPRVSTAERWREEAGSDFTFTMKAWQAVTHPASSPTWNNHRDALPETDDDIGYFRPTDPVLEAWEATRARAEALDATVIVFQTPPSFDCTPDRIENLHEFFDTIDRGPFHLAWEPRGDWHDNPDKLREICREHDLIDAVDIFRDEPVGDHDVGYVRLHGRNENLHDYDYDYDESELEALADRLEDSMGGRESVYCMFNNYEMYENATSFSDILGES